MYLTGSVINLMFFFLYQRIILEQCVADFKRGITEEMWMIFLFCRDTISHQTKSNQISALISAIPMNSLFEEKNNGKLPVTAVYCSHFVMVFREILRTFFRP